MGSYANFTTKEGELVTLANRKYFGYIDDEEYEQTETYKFLRRLSEDAVWMSNISYIGGVVEMDYEHMMIFKKLYVWDFYGHISDSSLFEQFYELMWHDVLSRPNDPKSTTYILSFD